MKNIFPLLLRYLVSANSAAFWHTTFQHHFFQFTVAYPVAAIHRTQPSIFSPAK